ncbi:MAG: cation transporter [Planctomycetes bacterium]|nr:cation transporter [Planctomycetota bacterium]
MAANGGISVMKFVGWFFTGSASMLAEAVHSVADTGNQALLLWGGSRAQRKDSEEHPFGYGRERYFWAFVVAIVLFALGGLFALYEGIEKLAHPHPLESPGWAIGILGVAIVLEFLSFRTALVIAEPMRKGRTWTQFVRTSKDPDIAVVLLEDLGAMLGLVIALVGVLLALWVDPLFDGIGTLAIGVLLFAIAVVLMMEMKSLLIGEAADPLDRRAIEEALVGTDGIRRVIHFRTMHLGPEEILLAAKVELEHALTLAEIAAAIDVAEAKVRAAVPSVARIYLEPDLYRERAT